MSARNKIKASYTSSLRSRMLVALRPHIPQERLVSARNKAQMVGMITAAAEDSAIISGVRPHTLVAQGLIHKWLTA